MFTIEELKQRIFAVSESIRYVAIYFDNVLNSSQRAGLENASSSETDKYEELIVNPTLLKLLTQRGNIDCGGMKYALIRYGSFFECVIPTIRGHVSVGMEADSDVVKIARVIEVLVLQNEAVIADPGELIPPP